MICLGFLETEPMDCLKFSVIFYWLQSELKVTSYFHYLKQKQFFFFLEKEEEQFMYFAMQVNQSFI